MPTDTTSSLEVPEEVVQAVREELDSPSATLCQDLPVSKIRISYSDVGSPDGHPVILLVGLGGNRFFGLLYKEAVKQLNLRLLTVDRPGRGQTTRCPPEDLNAETFAKQLLELLDVLQIKTFSVMGHSCGCIFAAALAMAAPPERLKSRVVMLAPWLPPSSGGSSNFSRYMARVPGYSMSFLASFVPYFYEQSAKGRLESYWGKRWRRRMAPEEVAYIDSPYGRELFVQSTAKFFSEGGSAAMVDDVYMCFETKRRCDVKYEDVASPVTVYHGENDAIVSLTTALWLEENLKDCKVVVKEGATHKLLLDLDFMAADVFANFVEG